MEEKLQGQTSNELGPKKISFTSQAKLNKLNEASDSKTSSVEKDAAKQIAGKDTAPSRKMRAKAKTTTVAPSAVPVSSTIEKVAKLTLDASAAPFIPLQNEVKKPAKARTPVAKPTPKAASLLETEVQQLRIRFAPSGFSQKRLAKDMGGGYELACVLPIVDPDFPYDLPSVRLNIVLPSEYPGSKEHPVRPLMQVTNTDLPSNITGRLERHLRWGIASLSGGALIVRPMLRFLEQNLERWMVDDPSEAAIKFVVSERIAVSKQEERTVPKETEDIKAKPGPTLSAKPGPSPKTLRSDLKMLSPLSQSEDTAAHDGSPSGRFSRGEWLAGPPVADQSCVSGGKAFSLTLALRAVRGIDLLTIVGGLNVLVSCDRCNYSFAVEQLRPFTDRIEHCPKCTNQTKFHFSRQLVTPASTDNDTSKHAEETALQEGLIGGVLRAVRARPVDLMPSPVQIACSRCYGHSEDASVRVEGVRVGEMVGGNCFVCRGRLKFCIDQAQWVASTPAGNASGPVLGGTASRALKQPVLSVGTPLPQNGACSHYKRSFRWYRFPCCGLAFACDECHANDAVARQHTAEWATRFICGFCSREMSISVKECVECGKDTSAAGRRRTAFWEGGKGVRNQVLMSRKDSKKYKDYTQNSSSSSSSSSKNK